MRYSLVSRFQGALVGAVLGELMGGGGDRLTDAGWRFGRQAQLGKTSAIADRLVLGAQTLIEERAVVPQVWRSLLTDPLPGESAPPSSTLAVALSLPVLLLFHGSAYERTSALEALTEARQDADFGAGVAVLAEAIALGLTDCLEPSTLLAHALEALPDLPDSENLSSLSQALDGVQTCLSTQKSLNQAERALTALSLGPSSGPARAIALAFYHFLSSPENPALALGRIHCTATDPRAVGALVGGLSGVHNGVAGLPLLGRLALSEHGLGVPDMRAVGAALAGAWAGAMDPAEFAAAGRPGLAIAAARVIRPR